MSDVVVYEFYSSIIKLCYDVGIYVESNSLLKNIRSGCPSPDSLRVMVKSHDADIVLLEKKVAKKFEKYRDSWCTVMDQSIILGIYEQSEAKCFVKKLEQVESVDDFRGKVRCWCDKELEIFKRDGCWTTDSPLSFGEFIELHQEGKLNHKDWPSRRRKIMSSKKDPVS